MLTEAITRYHGYATGKKWIPLLAERFGVSERGMRKGLENSFRESTLLRARQRNEEYIRDQLKQSGFSEDEIMDWIRQHPRGLVAGVVYRAQIPGKSAFPSTLAFARRIDELDLVRFSAIEKDDFPCAKAALLNADWLDSRYFAQDHIESTDTNPPLLLQAQAASTWTDLEKPAAAVAGNLLLSLLAQWDIEMRAQYCPSMENTPVFSLLLPLAGIDRIHANPRGRDLFRFPVSRLIDLLYAMHHRRNYLSWPDNRPALCELVPAFNESETNLINWRDGTKHLGLQNFVQLWHALFGPPEGSNLSLNKSLYVAAALFQLHFVRIDTAKRGKQVLLLDDEYRYWWDQHLHRAKQAMADADSGIPWPAWLSEA